MITIPQLTEKMIAFSNGNLSDIQHFLCVWAYAKTIGEQEGLEKQTLFLLEAAAILHDISCPLCREKYGNTDGKHQEAESPQLVQGFLADTDLTPQQIERISYLIAHHHTVTDIDGLDYQILIEADFLVNAAEKGLGKAAVTQFLRNTAKTKSGKRLLTSLFLL